MVSVDIIAQKRNLAAINKICLILEKEIMPGWFGVDLQAPARAENRNKSDVREKISEE